MNYVKVQNSQIIAENSELKLISFDPVKARLDRGGRRSKVFQAVVQLDIATYNKLLSAGQIFVGYDCCSVYDAIEITRCYNCCGYHHISAKCKLKAVCPKCSGDHPVKECSSAVLKCVNCFGARNAMPDIDFNHAAWDRGCAVFQQKLKLFKDDVLCLK